jgi:hypothetical protein
MMYRSNFQSLSSVEHGDLLSGAIVLEEFCKEIAAIAFVKAQASAAAP